MDDPCIKNITLLSYNIGLLDYIIPGIGSVYSYPEHAEERMHFVPDAIRKANADIVCLQECYTPAQVEYVTSSLKDLYPYYAHEESPGWWRIQNGMVTLSKYKIVTKKLQPYTHTSTLEQWFLNKSLLVSVTEFPGIGNLGIINIHTTAGGYFLPTHPLSDIDRDFELRETIECARSLESQGTHCVIIGDYNCGPYSSCWNWLRFRENYNYRDMFVEAYECGRWSSENGEPYTWHPTNFLNMKGPHKELPPDRLDHIMLSKDDKFWNSWHCSSARILFTEACVPVSETERSTISDHYGLLCSLTMAS